MKTKVLNIPLPPKKKVSTLKNTKACQGKFDCSVCMSKKPVKRRARLPCGHDFCSTCIKEWAKKETSCPLCRQAFLSYECNRATIHVKRKRQRSEGESELFNLIITATTKFLECKEYREQIRRELIERRSGIDLLVCCITRSLQILCEEGNREQFTDTDLGGAMKASTELLLMLRTPPRSAYV